MRAHTHSAAVSVLTSWRTRSPSVRHHWGCWPGRGGAARWWRRQQQRPPGRRLQNCHGRKAERVSSVIKLEWHRQSCAPGHRLQATQVGCHGHARCAEVDPRPERKRTGKQHQQVRRAAPAACTPHRRCWCQTLQATTPTWAQTAGGRQQILRIEQLRLHPSQGRLGCCCQPSRARLQLGTARRQGRG